MVSNWLLNNISFKSFRDHWKSLCWWSCGLFLIVMLIMSIFPSMKDVPGMNDYLEAMPKELLNLWVQNLENSDITSPQGFLNAELFTVMLPVIFIAFAINIGKGAVSGEEASGTLEMLLSHPVPRISFILHKIVFLVFMTILLGLVLCLSGYAGMEIFNIELGRGNFFWACVSVTLLGLLFGSITLFLGSYLGKSGIAVSVSAVTALAMYLLNALVPFVEGLEWMQKISPFYWYSGHDPISNGINFTYTALFVMIILALFSMAGYLFKSRDLRI